MGRSKWKNSGVVDQDVDLAASKIDRSSRRFPGARRIAKIGRKEVGLTACRAYFRDRLFAAFDVSSDNHDMDTQFG
jgi:hypothetical protein